MGRSTEAHSGLLPGTLSARMLLLLSFMISTATCQSLTTPATSDFPFDDIKDPSKQCVDIYCYAPIEWSDNKREVCRYRKEKTCKPVSVEKCIFVPVTTCDIFGYTECEDIPNPQLMRDDKVVGEYFLEQTCEHNPITVKEKKTIPECFNMKKNVCEKMWIPEAPYWKDTNCKEKEWQNCTLVPHHVDTTIDYCNCTPTEIWYNKFEKKETECPASTMKCEAKAVPVCKLLRRRNVLRLHGRSVRTSVKRNVISNTSRSLPSKLTTEGGV